MTHSNYTPEGHPSPEVKESFLTLHATCSQTLDKSFGGNGAQKMAQSYLFVTDLEAWTQVLASEPENQLFKLAEQEYLGSLLSLTQGQYRNAFKGLRLVLELVVQGTHLSANRIELEEWLRSVKDTRWAVLVGSDQKAGTEESSAAARGPFTARFCDSFFPSVREHASTFRAMASTLYRELSETIHGNVPRHIPIPASLEFDEDTFNLWHQKAETARLISTYCLTCRYLTQMNDDERADVEIAVTDQLGHIEPIRTLLGGPATE